MRRSNINTDQLSSNSEAQNANSAKKPGTLFIARFGIGKWHLGKADLVFDPNSRIEQFRTTVFILLLWFPLVPTGTYLVRKRRGYFSKGITVLKKLPLDWGQVLRVWGVAVCALLALIWVLKRI